jgi:hypothetical protein
MLAGLLAFLAVLMAFGRSRRPAPQMLAQPKRN